MCEYRSSSGHPQHQAHWFSLHSSCSLLYVPQRQQFLKSWCYFLLLWAGLFSHYVFHALFWDPHMPRFSIMICSQLVLCLCTERVVMWTAAPTHTFSTPNSKLSLGRHISSDMVLPAPAWIFHSPVALHLGQICWLPTWNNLTNANEVSITRVYSSIIEDVLLS